MRTSVVFALAILACVATPVNAQNADPYAPMNYRFQVYVGGFFPEVDSTFNINGEVLPPGPGLDFENVFGLEESKSVLWGGARWRISRRNNLEFEFVNLNRTGSVTAVSDPIEIGDSIVQAGGQVDTKFDFTVARLTYGFSVIRSERMDLQLKAGLHLADMSTSLQLTGAVCVDGEVPPNCSLFGTTPREESQDITAPLPHFGASFVYGITQSVTLRLQAIGFAIKLNKIDGSLLELDADLLWQPWEHFGIGAGVRYFDVEVKSKGSDLNGEFNFEYVGPTIFVMGSF